MMGAMKILGLMYFSLSACVGHYTGCTKFESSIFAQDVNVMNSSLCKYVNGLWSFTGEIINDKPSFILMPEHCSSVYRQISPKFLMFAKLANLYAVNISSITDKTGWCVADNLFFKTCEFANNFDQEQPGILYRYGKESDYINFKCTVNSTQQKHINNVFNNSRFIKSLIVGPFLVLVFVVLTLLLISFNVCVIQDHPTQI